MARGTLAQRGWRSLPTPNPHPHPWQGAPQQKQPGWQLGSPPHCWVLLFKCRDGRILAAGGKSNHLHLWCLEATGLFRIIQMPAKVRAVRHLEFLPDSFDAGSNQVSSSSSCFQTCVGSDVHTLLLFCSNPYSLKVPTLTQCMVAISTHTGALRCPVVPCFSSIPALSSSALSVASITADLNLKLWVVYFCEESRVEKRIQNLVLFI